MAEHRGTSSGHLCDSIVYIVDDDPAVRDSLQTLLYSVGLPTEVYSSASGFLEQADMQPGACLLLDIRMPGMSGLELQRKLAADGIQLFVILITGHGDVSMVVQAMKAGAFDFIEKLYRNQDLLERVYACLEQSRESREQQQAHEDARRRLRLLTARENQVLERMAEGKSSKVIAHELGISRKMVDVHRARIMSKVGVRSAVELIRYVVLLHKH